MGSWRTVHNRARAKRHKIYRPADAIAWWQYWNADGTKFAGWATAKDYARHGSFHGPCPDTRP